MGNPLLGVDEKKIKVFPYLFNFKSYCKDFLIVVEDYIQYVPYQSST